MHRLAAQVDRRRHRPGRQQGIAQLEERVGTPIQAGIEVIAEFAQGDEICVHVRKCATATRHGATATTQNSGNS